jgi:hypothetical protein
MRYIVPIITLLFTSCVLFHEPNPEWINNQPISEDTWFGIGSTVISGDNYREIARNKAIEEIASQIQVHIQSSFTNIQTENNLDFNQYSESIIQTRVNTSLPEIQIVDTFDNNGRYYVYAKLQKADYFRVIELKKQKAIYTAVDFMTSAESKLSIESFNYLAKAMEEITPFIDLPLKTEYPKNTGNQINLFSKIHTLAGDLSSRFQLITDKIEITTTIGIRTDHTFEIQCIDKLTNKPLSGIPLKASMGGNQITNNVITDNSGIATFHLFKVTDRTPVQLYEIRLDLSNIPEMINVYNHPTVSIKVNASSPNIYIDIKETNLNKAIENSYLSPVLVRFFVEQYGAEFVEKKKDSDFNILANINTNAKSKQKNEQGLYLVFADCTIQIYNTKSNKKLYEKSVNNVMGVDFTSIVSAGRHSLKKMTKRLEDNVFQEIITGLDEFSSTKTKGS